MTKYKIYAIIPARLGSVRLPRKMLLNQTGRPLVVHTYEAVKACKEIDEVIVATDSQEIEEVVKQCGCRVVLTAADHQSGTSRVREVAAKLDDAKRIINVQGDEPEIVADDLSKLVELSLLNKISVATLAAPLANVSLALSPDVVKVVFNRRGRVLYFSRSPVPYHNNLRSGKMSAFWFRHIGVYAFTQETLRDYQHLMPSFLDQEMLEQNCFLWNDVRVDVFPQAKSTHLGIDTLADYQAFCHRYARRLRP